MKNNDKILISILLGSVIIASAMIYSAKGDSKIDVDELDSLLASYQERQENKELLENGAKNELRIVEDDRVLGNRSAEISIFEYSDFECPFCKKFYTETKKAVEESNGKVNLIYRHFPGLHAPLSIAEASAAECAGDIGGDKVFFEYHDILYETTKSNGRSMEGGSDRGMNVKEFPKIAKKLGIDIEKFNKCISEVKFKDKITKNMENGSKIGVTGTPNAFVVNNRTGKIRKIGGYVPYSFIKAQIDAVSK